MQTPEVALLLRLKDMLSGPLRRVTRDWQRQSESAAEAATRATARSAAEQQRAFTRLASARQSLGIRSEQTIQREIRQTEAAYNRLARSGSLSANEQGRAFRSMTERVRELRREMGIVERSQRSMADRARSMARGGLGLAAGGWAAAQTMKSPIQRVTDYDIKLAQAANTAYSETEINGRKLSDEEQLVRRRTGKAQLESYIRRATAEGGTRDDALAALDKLIARGIVTSDDAGKLLPTITKSATAAGSSASDVTDIALAAIQNSKIPPDQIAKALGMALRAGQIGGFEQKDMARWLPKMLAMGSLSGLRGQDGLASVLAAAQVAITTSGGTDDAGNNVVNFLQKITAQDTANDFMKVNGKGKKGIDLHGTLAKARADGLDPVEAFSRLVERVAENDKEYVRLRDLAKATTDDGQKQELYASMADILRSRGIGKTVQDRQAMLPLLAMLNDPGMYQKNKGLILQGNEHTTDINQRFIKEQDGFKFQQGLNKLREGEYDSLSKLNGVLGEAAQGFANLSDKIPGLSTATATATFALSALSAAAAGSALMRLLTAGGPAATQLATGVAQTSTVAARAAAPALTFGAIANFTSNEEEDEVLNGEARWKRLRAQYSQKTIDAARKKFQPWYQFGEGYAAENEQWVKQYMNGQAQAKPQEVKVTVEVKNGNIVASVNQANAADARRR